jgi:hypothetical protein
MRAALGLAIVALAAAASPARADFFNDVRRTFQEDIPRTFQHDIPRALGLQGKPAAPAHQVKPVAPKPPSASLQRT